MKYILTAIFLLFALSTYSYAQEVVRTAQGGLGRRLATSDSNQIIISNGHKPVKLLSLGGVNQQLVSNGPNAPPSFQTVIGGGRSFKGHVVPTGVIDSSNVRFMLPDIPIDSSEYITLNGVVQYPTLGYTRGHDTILFISPPPTGSHIDASYFK